MVSRIVEPRYLGCHQKTIFHARLKVMNHAPYIVVVADKEKLQRFPVLPEQQTDFQSGAALENILSQPPDGNSAVRVRTAEAVGNHLQRGIDAGKIRIV
jgi:hypothetical protein